MTGHERSGLPTAEDQLTDLAELVRTGPVELGAYTQAEMAVALGDAPGFAGADDKVLAEAVRSLAARGVLRRLPGQPVAEVVGDLGLLVALSRHSVGTLEVRRGHQGSANADWRWMVSLFGHHVLGVDRIDALGIHHWSLVSVGSVSQQLARRMTAGAAKPVAGAELPVAVMDDEVRRLAEHATKRWQLIHRVPRAAGRHLVVDALVVRTEDDRVLLVSRAEEGGYQQVGVDAERLTGFIRGLFALT